MQRTRTTIASVLLLAAGAALAAAQPASAAPVPVPLAGTMTGADGYGPPTGCPAGAGWRYTSTGTGVFSHLGEVSFVVTHCSFPATSSFGPGTLSVRAANGDTLTLSDQGTFVVNFDSQGNPVSSDITMELTVTGGTGRFAGATGSATGTGRSDIAANVTTVQLAGKIVYDASNARAR